ncbi:MAG: FtsX-like permease family protein [Saprospiraceae bacterium]|nr:FtsX-like permease family protein [Saprospiraceae bacterium]
MNTLALSWKNLINRPLSMTLSVILFALGVGLISLLLLLNSQFEEKFEKNLAGIDLVVGAKGSPLQLILCNMYHIDNPTGNIDIKDAQAFLRPGHPLISEAIPLSLGDNYRNFRIVGTTHSLVELYQAKIAEGQLFEHHFDVTIGADVARALSLKLGDTFFSAHGFDHSADFEHESEQPFRVAGILAPSGAVIDQLILTTTPTIWMVHEHETAPAPAQEEPDHDHDEDGHDHEHDHEAHQDHAADLTAYSEPLLSYPDKQITSILLKFKNRNFQTLNMQRNINQNTPLQAATPAIEINRLFSMMGVGMDTLKMLAWVIVFVSGLSIFISLLGSLKDRKYELALMRVMGAGRAKLFLLILFEGLLIACLGYVIGICLSHLSIELLATKMQDAYRYSISGKIFLKEEGWLLAGCLLVGFVSALLPAFQAFRTDISDTLSEG